MHTYTIYRYKTGFRSHCPKKLSECPHKNRACHDLSGRLSGICLHKKLHIIFHPLIKEQYIPLNIRNKKIKNFFIKNLKKILIILFYQQYFKIFFMIYGCFNF